LVYLTKPVAFKEQAIVQKEIKETKAKKDSLFERLRKLRYKISLEENIPAYLVFSDATLKEMERARPMSQSDFLEISGVGQRKLEVYGDEFISEIISFMDGKIPKKKKGDTYKVTYDLYREGLTIDEIAENRNLSPTTIFSHLAKLYADGKEIDIYDFVTKEEVELVRKAKEALDSPATLKPYYDFLNDEMEYFKIRLALSILEKAS